MRKLNREFKIGNIGENKISDIIGDLLESRLNGDWTEYDKGDIIKYNFEFNSEDELDLIEEYKVNINNIKEFIGEGICYIIDEDIWYNIKFKDNKMVIKFEHLEI